MGQKKHRGPQSRPAVSILALPPHDLVKSLPPWAFWKSASHMQKMEPEKMEEAELIKDGVPPTSKTLSFSGDWRIAGHIQ